MTYTKPEIVVLGEASRTIQSTCNKSAAQSDPNSCGGGTGSSYDLDE
jgi:hypothetical protein